MRTNVLLKCSVCGEENYLTPKNKRNNPDRIELKKYCPRCQKQTVHKEKAKK
jgi:large subunit ribosomal protein L33